jgi:flagellar biosynthesis protein FlhB
MMSEESLQEKTQAPTPKKRREAAEEGQVPKSQEVTTAFVLLAAAGAITAFGGGVAESVVALFAMSVAMMPTVAIGPEAASEQIAAITWHALAGLAPFVLTLGAVALGISAVQARGVLTLKPLQPQWSRMNPLKKVGEIWGTNAIAQFLKSLFKLTIVSVAVWGVVDTAAVDMATLQQVSPFALLALIQTYTVKILLSAGLAYLVLAMADYSYQVWQHEKKLKMTREEVKKEVKESEGDQVIKVRRRTMAQQFARRRMMLSVSEADVVVTNPTHIAVALKYDPEVGHAPIVLAMGERKVAQRIKKLAHESEVPVIENKPLARALFATATVGQAIPLDLFMAVAEILAFVYRTRAGAGQYAMPGARA